MRRGILIVVAALAGVLFGALAAGPAHAHAAYKDSDPPDESTIASAPSEIWAEFTEPVSDASYLKVFNPCGMQVDNKDSRANGYRIYVSMADNTSGTYRVEFFANSEIDTHNTRGEFTFTITDGRGCPEASGGEVERERERDNRDRDSRMGAATGGSDTSGGAAAAGDSREGAGEARQRHANHRRHRNNRDFSSRAKADSEPVAAAPGDPNSQKDTDRSNIFTGIPIGGLLIALAFAALIGAAGGFIYAGIMGFTRQTRG